LGCAPLCKNHEHKNNDYADPNPNRSYPSHLSSQLLDYLVHGLGPPCYKPASAPTDSNSNQEEHPNFSKSGLQFKTCMADRPSSKTNASNLSADEEASVGNNFR
jgi:hypothetical protein